MMLRRLIALVGFCALAACASLSPPGAALDPLAERYVKLSLQIGLKEDGYIDAYHGPAAWEAEAKTAPASLAALAQEAAALKAALDGAPAASLSPLEAKRRAFLVAHVSAAQFRLRMIGGERVAFADEAEALFGVRPTLAPLASFDPLLARIDAAVPGTGPVAERIAALRRRVEIPPDRLRAVMDAAIAECRRRTQAHIALPANERFDLEFVTGKPWSGYNWFQGDARSLIQVNTDLPVTIDRAVDLGCHEGYPGHHVQNVLMEKLYKERGWVEFSVWPLFAPVGFIAEGTANAGIDVAFPGPEKRAFERAVLYPLAGIDPAAGDAYATASDALRALRPAEYTVAAAYLAGDTSRATAIAQLMRYQLVSAERAAKRLDFIDTYRSYIINYGLGQDMAAAYLARAGDSAAQWEALRRVLSEPTLPSDLKAR